MTQWNVSTSSDDAQDTGAAINTTNNQLIWNKVSITSTTGGWRFQNVTIANASTIDSATIVFTGGYSCSGAGGCNLGIWGCDEDDIDTWGASNYPSSTTRTTASTSINETTNFTPDSPFKTWTKDVKTIVQEIVDRGSWASGNDMGFTMASSGTWGRLNTLFINMEDSSYPEAKLNVTWTEASTGRRFNTTFSQ